MKFSTKIVVYKIALALLYFLLVFPISQLVESLAFSISLLCSVFLVWPFIVNMIMDVYVKIMKDEHDDDDGNKP